MLACDGSAEEDGARIQLQSLQYQSLRPGAACPLCTKTSQTIQAFFRTFAFRVLLILGRVHITTRHTQLRYEVFLHCKSKPSS